ncbi:carboxylesterase family protein [Nonomuraea sp. NPDC050643]|uniref:carboxylesterase family protein n=1 Tax=Nonomuraea sp. NPDC050643 TaxID=3155660 RepID=UPI0033EE3A6F
MAVALRPTLPRLLGTIAATAALLLTTVPAVPSAAASAVPSAAVSTGGRPVARTDAGTVRGARADGVDRFLALPYAAPPVGDLRWRVFDAGA